MKKIILTTGLLFASQVSLVNAEEMSLNIDINKLYVGAGFNQNVVDSPFGTGSRDAKGISFFAGYQLENKIDQLETSIEAGYSKTDDFFQGPNNDIGGLWLSGVAKKQLPEIDPRLSALAKVGVDFGDDDGIFMGAGAAFQFLEKVELRGEYLNKDASTVYQLSAVYHF